MNIPKRKPSTQRKAVYCALPECNKPFVQSKPAQKFCCRDHYCKSQKVPGREPAVIDVQLERKPSPGTITCGLCGRKQASASSTTCWKCNGPLDVANVQDSRTNRLRIGGEHIA